MRVVEFRRVQVERDMDLIREILLRIDADPTLNGTTYKAFEASDFEGHSQEEIVYHIDLLLEANLVIGIRDRDNTAISRLTWWGHEFIADTRDPDIWEKVKARTKGLANVGLALILEVAKAEIRKTMHLP
jgi:Hypothetical protein (DUF2513)